MPEVEPVVSLHAPVLGSFNSVPFRVAIEGLYAETCAGQSHAALQHWVDLIHNYMMSFAQPHRDDERLTRLWRTVEGRLGEDWSLDKMSKVACVSKEHLRRITRETVGRTPKQHLTFLRMHYAAELLELSEDTIDIIAHEVGYASAFAFSDTFQRWIGYRPSVFRKRIQSSRNK